MKHRIVKLTTALLLTASLGAEVFLATSPTNRLVVRPRQVIFVKTFSVPKAGTGTGMPPVVGGTLRGALSYGGNKYEIGFDPARSTALIAVALPCELSFYDQSAISFSRATNAPASIWTKFIYPGGRPYDIEVPSGKTIKFYALNAQDRLNLELRREGQLVTGTFGGEEEFSGPISLRLFRPPPANPDFFPAAWIVSYYFIDDPPEILVPLSIERSSDLKNWTPLGTFNAPKDGNSFYRLRVNQ